MKVGKLEPASLQLDEETGKLVVKTNRRARRCQLDFGNFLFDVFSARLRLRLRTPTTAAAAAAAAAAAVYLSLLLPVLLRQVLSLIHI